MLKRALIEACYLPPISYFVALQNYDEIILEAKEHYVKQSYRNRCYINIAAGRHTLVIPVVHARCVPITDVKIDHRQKWLDNHWRTIQSAYGKAPFFEYYGQDLQNILYKKSECLFDLNKQLLSLCLTWLGWKKPIELSKTFEKSTISGVKDLRNVIKAKNNTESRFSYKRIEYKQVFGHNFVPDLSIIDLVFCAGPEAGKLIRMVETANEQIEE